MPLGDHALMRMWTDAVGGRNTPLVGGDSRFGWNHLGPWLFYLMAVPYRLLGRSALGLLVGAGTINILSIVMICRCVRSVVNEQAAALICAGGLLFILTAPGPRLIDPWNPYVVQLPFLLALVAAWAVTNGGGQWLPWLIGAGSLSVQAHITFLPPVAVLVVIAVGCVVTRHATLSRSRQMWTLGVTVVAWAPAMLDVFLPGGHNVWRVMRFFLRSSPDSPAPGVVAGVRVVLRETGLSASWLGRRPGLNPFTAGFDGRVGLAPGLGLLVLIGAGWFAWHKRDRTVLSFVAILAGLIVTGVGEIAVARGTLFPYLFGWISLVGMLCWLAPLIALSTRPSATPVLHAARAAALTASIVVIAVSVHADQPRSPLERPADAAIVRQLTTASLLQLDPHRRYQLLHGHDSFNSIYELGVVDELRRRHIHIVVNRYSVVLFGRHMIDSTADTYPALEVVAPFDAALPGERVIAVSDPGAEGRSVAVVLLERSTDHRPNRDRRSIQ